MLILRQLRRRPKNSRRYPLTALVGGAYNAATNEGGGAAARQTVLPSSFSRAGAAPNSGLPRVLEIVLVVAETARGAVFFDNCIGRKRNVDGEVLRGCCKAVQRDFGGTRFELTFGRDDHPARECRR